MLSEFRRQPRRIAKSKTRAPSHTPHAPSSKPISIVPRRDVIVAAFALRAEIDCCDRDVGFLVTLSLPFRRRLHGAMAGPSAPRGRPVLATELPVGHSLRFVGGSMGPPASSARPPVGEYVGLGLWFHCGGRLALPWVQDHRYRP